jgi:hypothetical protein
MKKHYHLIAFGIGSGLIGAGIDNFLVGFGIAFLCIGFTHVIKWINGNMLSIAQH